MFGSSRIACEIGPQYSARGSVPPPASTGLEIALAFGTIAWIFAWVSSDKVGA